uniref:uncharacterized protein LOC122602961 n=1 Tax=Erigeron canadensis TaxID=72917 RepID=UPI001CB93B27|nr:uncharacterized protein LOC122602961 [Erigeron canadensis]
MADEDDDDSFGEFTFAPSSTTQTPTTGDFTSHQNKSPHQKWQKINGAIPLSLFGDPDDFNDHESQEDLKNLSFSGNSNGFVSNSNNDINRKNGNLEINDLIANLYGDPKQLNHNKNNVSKVVDNGNVYKDPVSNSGSADHGSDDDDEEGGWDFVDAFSDSKNDKDKDNKERVVTSVSNGGIDLFDGSNNGVFVESNGTGTGFNSKPTTSFQNGFNTELKAEPKGAANELSSEKLGETDDFDDTFGEFETAFVENSSTKKELSEEKFDPLGSYDVSHRPIDLFAFSNGVLGGSHKENNEFNFSQSPVVQNGVASDPVFQTEWKETKDDSYSQSPDMGADDEDFGEFEATFPEAGLKPEGSMASSKSYKEAVPLSIFGIEEEPEADSSLNLQLELFKSSTHLQNPSSNLSINDILSDLYSQAQPISSANNEGNPDGNVSLLHSTGEEYSSRVVDDDDDFNDGSWEFKDASFQSSVENENLSFKKKLNHCMDLYSNLKDDLLVVARHHIHGLKEAQSAATLVGEEMKVATINKDIQEALKELHQEDIIAAEMDLDKHSERVTSLDQYIETLCEPDFQAIESEYHISRRLSLAESDLRTAIDLINHFTTVLKILTLAPKADPADYVSLWSKMIFVCSQELKHGISIWKRSLELNIHNEILVEPQGKDFIIAIGEIYRAVVILGSAVKFYKPWILLSGANLEGMYCLLEECHSLWSTSGLEETFPAESLLDSIRHIRNHDELAITNEILSQEESQCVLSLLFPAVVPEMKLVIWNGDKYFVSLANLWANLVSPNPPKLSIHVG